MDDALQEGYVRAFRALPRFRGDARFGTWLYGIVYNACLDELVRSHRLVVLPLEEVGSADDPGEEVVRPRDLAEALAALPPPDRAGCGRGAVAGVEAEVLIVPRNIPHLWAQTDALVVTVAGDLGRSELLHVTESLRERP